ncbi:MAG TPA: M56 family metallopeptidase [Rubricoccaceae bacterium]|nr:M56 family metallopeptidase [Rubricoccaceae bacterium]
MDGPDLLSPGAWSALLALTALKGLFLLLLAAASVGVLRSASAAARHLVWALAFGVLLALPLLLAVVPGWQLPVLPAEVPGPAAFVASATATETIAPSGPSLVLLGWALGALAVMLRWGAAGVGAAWLTVRARPASVPLVDLGARLAREVGLRQPVTVAVSDRVRTPMTWGVRRPVVLLPTEAETWTEERLAVVLAHELAHVRRADCLTQWIAQVACAVHWFNPLVWLAYRRFLLERERAADDAVLGLGMRPSAYAAHLLHLARASRRRGQAGLVMVQMAHRSQLEARLRAILGTGTRRSAFSRSALASAAVLALSVAVPVVAVHPVARQAAPSLAEVVPQLPVAARAEIVSAADGAGREAAPAGREAAVAMVPPPSPEALAPAPDARVFVTVEGTLATAPKPVIVAATRLRVARAVSGPQVDDAAWMAAMTEAPPATPTPPTAERTRAASRNERCVLLDAAVAEGLDEADRERTRARRRSGDWTAYREEATALRASADALARASAQWAAHDWDVADLGEAVAADASTFATHAPRSTRIKPRWTAVKPAAPGTF